eukprot:GILI01010272.1.p1 GENE.GILI01010272.1~~GILI01010272.1.p1  ORF type:complete len:274 (+),score=69.51 GILI01010272.1:70-891(+)
MAADPRVSYCKDKNIHHLFELLATKVLHDRPENPFEYLRHELAKVEESEKKPKTYDPTVSHSPQEVGERRGITIAVLGLDNAGKTALISLVSGELNPNTTPTVGFDPTTCDTGSHIVRLHDLGGGGNFRGIWQHYFHDCHAFIYVIDGADRNRFAESAQCFKDIASHEYMKGKPVLVIVNKKDLPSAASIDEVSNSVLKISETLPSSAERKVIATCAIRMDEVAESGIEWMIKTVDAQYQSLEARVAGDMKRIKEEKEEKRKARLAALAAADN